MPRDLATSGDLIADRRFAYAKSALADADCVAARDLFAQTLEIAPDWPPALHGLAEACLALGEIEAARAAAGACLAADPADRLGAALILAKIEGCVTMPPAYIAALFDEYAPRFDRHLTETLHYRAPGLIAQALLAQGAARHVLDLGCGTGLMARALPIPGAEWTGIDLSAGMLAKARETGLYTRLERMELLDFLRAADQGCFDLILAADVLCYVPDLAPVLAAAFRVLEPGGRLAFTIQTHPGEGVVLGADCRVHHAPALVRMLGLGAGFVIVREMALSARQDRGMAVPGGLFILAKP
jgi:predicted TPR repeat methyltransferase